MKTFFCFIVVRPLTYSMPSASPPAAQPTLCVRLLLWSWAVNEKCRPAIIAKVWCVKTLIFALRAQEPGISANFFIGLMRSWRNQDEILSISCCRQKTFSGRLGGCVGYELNSHKGWVFVAVGSLLSHEIYCECNEPAYFIFHSLGENLKSYLLHRTACHKIKAPRIIYK